MNQITKIFILSIGFMLYIQAVNAQLITDSDRRLKTQKSDRKESSSNRKKNSTANSKNTAGRQSYKFSSARYSPESPFRTKRNSQSPRFSQSRNVALLRDKKSAPRYSGKNSFSTKLASGPRYSPGSPYSRKDLVVNPRYSKGSPFRPSDFPSTTRYSEPRKWNKGDLAQRNPRYSPGSPWSKSDREVSVRYSAGSPFEMKDKRVSPRYSMGSPYENEKWGIKVPYSTMKNRFDIDKRMKKQSKIYNFYSSNYKGERSSGFNKSNTMHPSSAYASANPFNYKTEDVLRQWNVFWSRLDGNKVQPTVVKEKVVKPKFDRKETDIWNN